MVTSKLGIEVIDAHAHFITYSVIKEWFSDPIVPSFTKYVSRPGDETDRLQETQYSIACRTVATIRSTFGKYRCSLFGSG